MSLFAETAPPPQNLITNSTSEDFFGSRQIMAFQEQLLSTIDVIKPRIEFLEKSIKSSERNFCSPSSFIDSSADLNSSLKEIQADMPDIHEISIKLSRRIQNLSLRIQTVTTIAAPKQLRPVQEEFFSFKDEFDLSLRNIATLTRGVSQKVSDLNIFLEKYSTDYSKKFAIFSKEVEANLNKSKKNADLIEELRVKIGKEAETCFSSVTEKVEKSLKDAEDLVTELEALADKGLANSNEKIVKLQNDKFDIQSSFDTLLKEIDSTINDRINDLREKINKNTEKSDFQFSQFDKYLTHELDEVTAKVSASPVVTVLDQMEERRQAEDLTALLLKIEKLKNGILNHEYDKPLNLSSLHSGVESGENDENFEEEEDEEDEEEGEENKDGKNIENGGKNETKRNKKDGEDDNEEEDEIVPMKIVTVMIDGEKRNLICFPENGTFEMK